MQLTAACLLIFSISLSVQSQSQTVTIKGKNISYERIFIEIKKQTGYTVITNQESFDRSQKVSLDLTNVELTVLLRTILRDKPFDFEIRSKTIFIKEKANLQQIPEVRRTAPIPVYGDVKDEKGSSLMGANISINGTARVAISNEIGSFHLDNVEPDAVLVVSFVGYLTQEIKVAGTSNHTIILKLAQSDLKEVTVSTGYWETTKAKSTGNISKINSKVIEGQPVLNPLQAMQGRMAGVQITQSTGVPGGGFSVQIRGRNSLRNDGNNPLYIIDGVPFTGNSLTTQGTSIIGTGNPLSLLNPDDISSIEVLKDADATAIYGSRGGNGVVLITTKKGKAGKTSVDLNASFGVGKVAHFIDLLNTKQYLELRHEALKNDGLEPVDPTLKPYLPDVFLWDSTKFTDWQKELIGGSAKITDLHTRIYGGNQYTQYALGANYYTETTVFPGEYKFKRGGGYFNISHRSENRKFFFTASANFSASANDLNNLDLTTYAITLAPNNPELFDNKGGINWNDNNDAYQNPANYLVQLYRNTTNRLNTNATLGYEIIAGLEIKASLGYNNIFSDEISTLPLKAVHPAYRSFVKGSTTFANSWLKNWIIEPKLTYVKSFGRNQFNVLAGFTIQESRQEGKSIYATGYANDDLLENISAAPDISIMASNYAQYRFGSFYSRLNYTYDDKYILNVTGRRDGSSRFGPGKQFGNFYAVGAGWIFSKEDLIQSRMPVLSFGKLRGSYGLTGNDQIGDYQYLNTYTPNPYPYLGSTGLTVSRLLNPDFSWETNKKLELALELGFFNDRLFFSSAWYRNRSSDQLVGLPLPAITGQTKIQFNLPATVQNTGWEFELTSVNINRATLRWTTDLNVTLPKNKLIAFPNIGVFPAYKYNVQVGQSLFIRNVLQYTGVDATTGSYAFRDLNGDGTISVPEDGSFLKEVSQKFFGGINNSFSYKGFELGFLFQFVKQTGYSFEKGLSAPGAFSNQPVEVLNRWQKAGDNPAKQMYTVLGPAAGAYSNYVSSDDVIVDASFIRLKNASLSWTWPSRSIQKYHISGAKLFLRAQNLFTITGYVGLDPETQSLQALPALRVITAGIQFTL